MRVDLGAGKRGGNIEARAREARYCALRELLVPGEALLTAHHADDQLETLLMRLLRGGGVAGLRGIVEVAPFGPGRILRPLLAISRQDIRAVATAWRLEWLEDPANRDPSFDRNYVRGELLGAIHARWPAASRAAVRTGRQMRDAEQILADMARQDLGGQVAVEPVSQAGLAALSPPRRRNLLRHLIDWQGLPTPNAAQLAELEGALQVVRLDARTTVRWPGAEARIYGGRLYLLEPLPPASASGAAGRLTRAGSWTGPEGRLELVPAVTEAPGLSTQQIEDGLDVRFRRGGERLAAPGRRSRSLKHFLQESRVVPWMRDRVPLLYAGERLVAVGDLWCAGGDDADIGPRWRVAWTRHPPLR